MMKGFHILCLFSCLIFFSDCNNINSNGGISVAQEDLFDKTQNQINVHPDSALLVIDKVLRQVDENEINDKYLLKMLELKQKAFSNLLLMDSFFVTGERIREVASRIPDSLAMAKTLIRLYSGVDYKHIKKAKDYIPGAIAIFKKNGMFYEAAMITALNGMILSGEGDYLNAQKYFLKAYEVFEDLDSLKAIGKVCTNMGNNYAGIGSMDESTLYYTKSLRIAEKRKDTLDQVAGLMNIGINYRSKSPDTAMGMYVKALQLLPANSSKLGMKVKFNLANLYLDKQDIDRAAAIMKEIEADCEKTKYMEGVGIANNGLAAVYFLKKKYPEALERYQKAINTFNSIGLNQIALNSQNEMIECYKAMGDFKNAFINTEILQKKKDTIFSIDKEVAVHELEKKYRMEKKELENSYLKRVASIRNIALLILIISVIALFFLLKKSNWLYKQRELAYNVLMARYKEERLLQKNEKEEVLPLSDRSAPELTTVLADNNLLIHRLESYFETQKPYLNPKLKVEEVASFLDCTQKEINSAFKTQSNLNFNTFTNRYRVKEARRLFDDNSNEHLKLETIAAQSGFGNRQSFYAAFEQFTGVKPGYYRKNIMQQNTGNIG